MVSDGLGASSLSGKSVLGGSLSDRRGCYAFGVGLALGLYRLLSLSRLHPYNATLFAKAQCL
ncbi:hypothetical protein SAMN05216586_10273 [Halopseudomonas aestusnigri]|uniref:Uncharacterized protein n=1 Tax=Halopseudomonas aestusnigri TaxID=857252 RepID=A0AAQ1JP41_9GAMM|nr:hypothetical protein SAMN05216586_10273 [Halopseudomonas aestusnigri]